MIAQTDIVDSPQAGKLLGRQIGNGLLGEHPDAVILFASAVYDYSKLMKELMAECSPGLLVGCSSAGEFTGETPSGASACAVGIRSSELGLAVGLGRGISKNRLKAAKDLVNTFRGISDSNYQHRSVLLLTDALAGYTEEFMEHLTVLTAGRYQIFGGGAGDDAKFSKTHVFLDGEAVTDAAVALEILSNKPLGIGVSHGWRPASKPMLVTEATGARVMSLNSAPATEVFEDYAQSRGDNFDSANPLPFFLHNIIGIQTPDGYKLRVPLSAEPDGSVVCAAEVPVGSTVCMMRTTDESAGEAAERATKAALNQVATKGPPALALFFDCAATRLRMGRAFDSEVARVSESLGSTQFIGCNTYGQVARIDGQFSGFHNCTAVICIIPE
ncbi:MAG: FIST C-terminal domain-containing protein [Acidobacteriota bacterium]|nr:FIST C-terminal domain-containing protein [Acidobacteriota bacterium]